MKDFKRITILLKESSVEDDYNKRIVEYLNDRHRKLNDIGFVIAVEMIDDSNINKFIKLGITSTPALMVEDDIQYGVNSILATLAKLEIVSPPQMDHFADNAGSELADAHHNMLLEEMNSTEQEDENPSEPSMSSGDMESRMSAYNSIYDARKKRNTPGRSKPTSTPPKHPAKVSDAKRNVENLIASKGYDAGEAAFRKANAKQ